MGGLSIDNLELRCVNCFHIFSMKIKPEFPIPKITKSCNCESTEIDISTFLTEYKKNKKYTISCSNCNKQNPKESIFCNSCKKLICLNCLKSTHSEDEEMKNHRCIYIDKIDFFCINHFNEQFCAYCKTCKINICSKCIQENTHEKHKLFIFNKNYDEKKMKEFLKKGIKVAEGKIEYNKVICNMICKKINKPDVKNMKTLNETNEIANKNILETINIFCEMYEDSKNKNYALISNLIDNIDFNLEKIKFEKNTTKDKDMEDLANYFKTDFILKVKGKKDLNKNTDKDIDDKDKEKENNTNETNSENNQNEEKAKDNNEIKDEENKENVEKNEEKKSEEEHKDEENKNNDEEKKDEKIEEEKKEEENKEDEKKEKEKKEEEKKTSDDGHPKSLKEITALLSNKINSQGGFRSSSNMPTSNKNNDIIHEPKGNPENVVNIIQNQKIIKKTKKKPKKINFDS